MDIRSLRSQATVGRHPLSTPTLALFQGVDLDFTLTPPPGIRSGMQAYSAGECQRACAVEGRLAVEIIFPAGRFDQTCSACRSARLRADCLCTCGGTAPRHPERSRRAPASLRSRRAPGGRDYFSRRPLRLRRRPLLRSARLRNTKIRVLETTLTQTLSLAGRGL